MARAGWKPPAPADTPTSGLGGIERTCNECRAPWKLGQSACACGSVAFDERVIGPTPIEFAPGRTGLGGFIRAAVVPSKPTVAPLAAEDVAVLKQAAEVGRAYIAALVGADAVARRLVRARIGRPETTGYLQDKLSLAASTLGDTSYATLEAKGSLVLPIKSLSDLIEETLARENAT